MTITERVNGERLILLAWGRAILMQLAHPLVAQGVADHSSFRDATLERVRRLHGTIKAMLDLTFGDAAPSGAATDRINAIHDRVHGRLCGRRRPMDRRHAVLGDRSRSSSPGSKRRCSIRCRWHISSSWHRSRQSNIDAYCAEVERGAANA